MDEASAASAESPTAAGFVASAATSCAAGKPQDADALLRSALLRWPADLPAWIAFARLAQQQDNWQAALIRWAAVHAAAPARPDGLIGLATCLIHLDRLTEAEEKLAETAAAFPDHVEALTHYARVAAQRRDWTAAAQRWARVRTASPDMFDAYILGAQALRDSGAFDAADEVLRQAIHRFPDRQATVTEYAWVAHIRRDWSAAVERWADVRVRHPQLLVGFERGAEALRHAGRASQAEALLAAATIEFPGHADLFAEAARLAAGRGDPQAAIQGWAAMRAQFPDRADAYIEPANLLLRLGRTQEADALIEASAARFPEQLAPALEQAKLALRRRDTDQALALFADLAERFPRSTAVARNHIVALRDRRRFPDADAVAEAALQRFPGDTDVLIDHAWVAVVARDWPAATERWAAVHARLPGNPEPYIQGARALREAWRYDEAAALLADAATRFPNDADPVIELAWLMFAQNRLDDAAAQFAALRERFPNRVEGWEGGARVLRNRYDLAAADALLQQAMRRFPDRPRLMLDYAQLPVFPVFAEQKDWPETFLRLDRLLLAFADFEDGYVTAVRLYKQAHQPDRAEEIAQAGSARLPQSYTLAIQCAEAAEDRRDWAAAAERYASIRERFPALSGGELGRVRVLVAQGRIPDAECALRDLIVRFDSEPEPSLAYIDLAMRTENWAEAVRRGDEAAARFPGNKTVQQQAYLAKMRFSDADPNAALAFANAAPAPMPDPNRTDAKVRELVTQFESLGGRHLGCEFGIFQRDCGAEPLGLLRWADMPYDRLLTTLRDRFAGVGTAEHTELFVSNVGGDRGEYCTRDRRGMMFMRTFVHEDEYSFEKMQASCLNRLRFLTRKLITDLEAGSKIFVFRVTDRNLTETEIDDLHGAMRTYGDNTLLYVRYEDAAHPNGTVVPVKPGLLIGYIDRFKISPQGQLAAVAPTASWLSICRNAFALWKPEERVSPQADGPAPAAA